MSVKKEQVSKKSGWVMAAELVMKYTLKPAKIDQLLSKLPEYISSTDRRLCQFLFFGYIRHKLLIDAIIKELIKKEPRPYLSALLKVAMFELVDVEEDRRAKVVHNAVRIAKGEVSQAEAKLVNAVLRRVIETRDGLLVAKSDEVSHLALANSHPKWLVGRWLKAFGESDTVALLKWDQGPAKVYARLMEGEEVPGGLEMSGWANFYSVRKWDEVTGLLEGGRAYIQDPSTRHPVELLAAGPGERVLDLCAAPGGKSFGIVQGMKGEGELVAVDMPGGRIGRLRENLGRFCSVKHTIIEEDVLELGLDTLGGDKFNAILVDVPCSNTGVLQRRPDAKWRLEKDEFEKLAKIQLALLEKAASFLGVEGRLVYSTCSIDREENEGVVEVFLNKHPEFELESKRVSYPWEAGHDGGGAFLLRLRG